MQFRTLLTAFLAAMLLTGLPVKADPKSKTYEEISFIRMMTNKSMKQVTEMLGEPVRKEISVKPVGADSIITQRVGKSESKPVNVEMWYYKNIVSYAPKKTYKTTELTFVNGRCNNVALFNNQ